MLKILLKIGFVLSILGLLFHFSDMAFKKDHFYNKTIKIFKESSNVEIAIFGSSHAHTAYDPRLIESEIEIATMNFGALDQKLETTALLADYVLNKNKLQLAIIDVFTGNVAGIDTDRAKTFQLETLDHLPFSFNKARLMYSAYDVEELPMSVSTTIRNHAKWYDLKDFNWNKRAYIWSGIDYFKGFRSYKDSISEKQWNRFVSSKKAPWTPDKMEEINRLGRIDQIIKLFKDNGIPMLFVNAPSFMNDYSILYKSESKKIKEHIEGRNIEFLDFNLISDSLGLTKRHFIDADHLNAKGALIVSEYLANYLQKNFTFDFSNKMLKLEDNRYRHFSENFQNTIYNKTIKQDSIDKTKGMLNLAFYKVSDGTYEILIETKTNKIEPLPYKLFFYYANSEIGQGRRVYSSKINYRNMYVYQNRNFIVVPVDFPDKKIKELTFNVGKKYDNELFKFKMSELH